MERLLGIPHFELNNDSCTLLTTPEVGENGSPSKALLFKGGSVSVISGKSSYLADSGFKPYDDSHFNTQFALAVTQALATFHAMLRARGIKKLEPKILNTQRNERKSREEQDENKHQREDVELPVQSYTDPDKASEIQNRDSWTCHISRPSLVSSNLSILCAHFEHENVSSRIIRKLESLQRDITTFAQFLLFSSAMQTEKRLQSVGPVGMGDVWVPNSLDEEDEGGETLVIRLRGGSDIQAPPLRDISWIWLTLLRPQILQERYMELCESYCSAFNDTIKRLNATKNVEELTLFDIMRDLGDSFLHGFLTIVHKFTVSGVWPLDRQLHTSEGIITIAESIGFLIDNGIIGSLFIV